MIYVNNIIKNIVTQRRDWCLAFQCRNCYTNIKKQIFEVVIN